MGRPPSNGGPAFRFNAAEVLEMETILQDHNNMMPAQEVLVALADKFSNSPERQGKFVVQTKQIWNWFQNKRYAIRARTSKIPTNVSSMPLVSTGVPTQSAPVVSTMPATQTKTAVHIASSAPVISREDNLSTSRLPHSVADAPGKISADNSQLDFEARSARDGAWYDVASFLSLKNLEAGCPEVLVRFAGFGPEEDEWINVMTHVRHRSLPCDPSECVAVLPGDLVLCFQEGKEQALYFDAHVLDAQRRRHDARGCRCRFLVRYDHDQSEEIVPLRKICRRPETDYRLQQLHAMNETSAEQRKSGSAADHMKSVPAKEQHKIMSSVEQKKTDVDSMTSKPGISSPVTLSDQKPSAPISLVHAFSISEEQNGDSACSVVKIIGDKNTACSNSQLSRPEVINLDPETEVENTSHEVKDAADDMTLDEPLVRATDIMPECGVDATASICLPAEKKNGMPMRGINSTATRNMAEEFSNQAPVVVGTKRAPKAEQVDPEPMLAKTNMTSDEGKTNIDHSKDETVGSTGEKCSTDVVELINQAPLVVGVEHASKAEQADPVPTLVDTNMTTDEVNNNTDHKDETIGSTDTSLNRKAIIPLSSLPADAEVNEIKVDGPAMTSSMGNVALEQNILETSGSAATGMGKTDTDPCNATLSGTRDDADHPINDSGHCNSPTMNVPEKNDDQI